MFQNIVKVRKNIPAIIVFVLSAIAYISADPLTHPRVIQTNHTIPKDDFTTQFAKQIMRRSKAADIQALLNPKIDPCTNFYQYTCGNWHRNNPAQLLGHLMTDKFQMIARAFDRRLENALNEQRSENKLEAKVKGFFHSCKLLKDDEVLYKLDLEKVYKEYGELPVLAGEKWNEESFVWWEMVARIQNKYGNQIILAVDIMGDVKNNTENRIYIGAPDFSIGSSTKLINILQEMATVQHLQHYFGVEQKLARKTAKEMIEFQHKLVQGGTDERLGLGLDSLLELVKVDHLKKTYNDSLDMGKFLELVLSPGAVPEEIYIYDAVYFENMLKTIKETPKRIVSNYILWELLQEYMIDKSEEDLTRWCIERTKKYFGKYIDHFVYQRYRNEKMEQDVQQIWEEVRNAFRDQLKGDKLDWISNSTRESAIEKLNSVRLSINSYDDLNFTAEFGDLQISSLDYVKNVQQILMHESGKDPDKMKRSPKSIESTEVLSFTPAYNILENAIKIPVALLQPRFFWDDATYPRALKYGTLGYLIAHELVHGFDDDGRNYDKKGNYKNWWDPKSTYEFEERRKCLMAQYHNYKYGGQRLPESISQSENIADNAGIKLAYAAYDRWLQTQENKEEIEKNETLPGLPFDNRQLFFVSFAQVWCDDVQSLFKRTVASEDSHAPSMYRVIGSLSNFQEFSWVFKCKQDAPMDPEFKCAIY